VLRPLTLWIFLICLSLSGAARADEEVCRRFTESTLAHAMSIIRDTGKSFPQKHAELSGLFESSVDIDWLGQRAAGEYWRRASEQERGAYARSYRAYLTNYYVGSLNEADLATILDINLTKFKTVENNVYHARIKITQSDDDPADVDLHLVEDSAGNCHIHDFTAQGVSMLDSQSEEIGSLGKMGGLVFITDKLSAHR